jgi:hypothetical protein
MNVFMMPIGFVFLKAGRPVLTAITRNTLFIEPLSDETLRQVARGWPFRRESLKHTAHGVKKTLLLIFGDRGWLRLSLPPLLSIRPTFLSVFDAGLVTDAGGEKRASRSGCQDEQE